MVDWQLTIDANDPPRLVAFWAPVLGYEVQPPPQGHESWKAYYLSVGVPEDEAGDDDWSDRIWDPTGAGPRIWFQVVPESKSIKNRLHIDVRASGGHGTSLESRRELIEAEAARLVALGATRLRTASEEDLDHYAVSMADPEGNEFDVH